jgi:ABC-type sugar transport system ATPase subunit
LTTVYVTHDQEEALTMSDRIAVMRDGRIEQSGAPRTIYRQPENTFVAGFLGGSNLIPLIRNADNSLRPAAVPAIPEAISPEEISLPSAERLQLFFRPEETNVSRQPPGGERLAFRLPVRYVEYVGSYEIVEGSADGLTLRALVHEQERRSAGAVGEDEEAWFSVSRHHARVISE